MPHILVTGANGQVGQALQNIARQWPSFSFHFTDRTTLDITDGPSVKAFFEKSAITHCINCAAYTAVDKAETEDELARKINVEAVGNLARACASNNARLIQISSDYVYHNDLNRPLLEDDPTKPRSVYARTKLGGDLVAMSHAPNTVIFRTSWVYGEHGHNFVKTMIRLGAERDRLGIVYDQIGAPTYTADIASALLHIVDADDKGSIDKEAIAGVYHYSNEGVCSWYDFALAIFDEASIACEVSPILSEQYPTPAARPHFSVMDKNKIKTTFGIKIPHWRESLKQCIQALTK